jgi:hypothetical protein
MKTYLELVNTVLVAMREAPVSDVTQSNYTRLVGELINDAKEQVEDAHSWAAQLQTFNIGIIAYEGKYSLTGYGQRGIIDSVVSLKNNNYLSLTTRRRIQEQAIQNPAYGDISEYANVGVDPVGNSIIQVAPMPSDNSMMTITGWFAQSALKDNADILRIPHRCVTSLAIALAVRERGEVTGQVAAEYFEIAKRSLSDAIAYDAARNEDEDEWYTI